MPNVQEKETNKSHNVSPSVGVYIQTCMCVKYSMRYSLRTAAGCDGFCYGLSFLFLYFCIFYTVTSLHVVKLYSIREDIVWISILNLQNQKYT